MDNINIFITIVFIVMATLLTLLAFNRFLPKRIGCEFFTWHFVKPDEKKTFDGCSIGSKCARCDKDVKMDSQGNWF